MKHGTQSVPGASLPINSVPLSDPARVARLRGMKTKKRLSFQIGQTKVLVTPSAFPTGFATWVDGKLAGLTMSAERAMRLGAKIALAQEADRSIERIEKGSLNGDGETVRGTECPLAFDVGKTPIAIVPSPLGWDYYVGGKVHACVDRETAIVQGVAKAIQRELKAVFR